ncbi:MAG: hypothetical protein GEU80_07435 [Dehalococcoidia bacterium]|nr:hypothetical protein [Dehalococcoidia bacterium]
MTKEYDKPLVENPTYNSAEWWAAAGEHRLLYQRCTNCNRAVFPPRGSCPGPDCLVYGTLQWSESHGAGRVFSYTVVRQPADQRFARHVPYVFALIELDEGFRLFSNVTDIDPAEVRIGQSVQVYWDDVTADVSLPKFRIRG